MAVSSLKALNELFTVSGIKKELDEYAYKMIWTSLEVSCSHNILIQAEGEKLLTTIFSKYSKSKILGKVEELLNNDRIKEGE